jgi:hypothetical protein
MAAGAPWPAVIPEPAAMVTVAVCAVHPIGSPQRPRRAQSLPAAVLTRHGEERGNEAIQPSGSWSFLDCFAALAMTGGAIAMTGGALAMTLEQAASTECSEGAGDPKDDRQRPRRLRVLPAQS